MANDPQHAEILQSIAEARRQSAASEPEGSFARECALRSFAALEAGVQALRSLQEKTEEKKDGAALLPVDPSASPASTEALANKERNK